MKKEVKAVIAVVLAVWFFLMGFEIGGYREKKKIISETTAAIPVLNTPTTTAAPTTVAELATSAAQTTVSEQTPAQDNTTGNNTTKGASDETTKAADTDPATLSKTQIVEKVAAALNAVKAEQNMKAVKK